MAPGETGRELPAGLHRQPLRARLSLPWGKMAVGSLCQPGCIHSSLDFLSHDRAVCDWVPIAEPLWHIPLRWGLLGSHFLLTPRLSSTSKGASALAQAEVGTHQGHKPHLLHHSPSHLCCTRPMAYLRAHTDTSLSIIWAPLDPTTLFPALQLQLHSLLPCSAWSGATQSCIPFVVSAEQLLQAGYTWESSSSSWLGQKGRGYKGSDGLFPGRCHSCLNTRWHCFAHSVHQYLNLASFWCVQVIFRQACCFLVF